MNKLKFILLLAFLGFNTSISWGQNLTQQLRGTIVDRQTKNVLADASVVIKDAKLIAISDSNGKFSFSKIPIAKYDLVISKRKKQSDMQVDSKILQGWHWPLRALAMQDRMIIMKLS